MIANLVSLRCFTSGRLLFLLACVALGLTLAACSSSDDGGGSAAPSGGDSPAAQPTAETGSGDSDGGSSGGEIDACSVLLPEDVEAEIGAAPEPNGDPVGPFSSCGYFDTATNFVQLQTCACFSDSQFDDSSESAAEFLETEAKPVDGVGDKAYWLAGILWVKQGDLTLNLWISKAAYYEADGTALEGDALEAVALPDTKALALKLLGRVN